MYHDSNSLLGDIDWTALASKSVDAIVGIKTASLNAKLATTQAKLATQENVAAIKAQQAANNPFNSVFPNQLPTNVGTGYGGQYGYPVNYSQSTFSLSKYMPMLLIGGAAILALTLMKGSSGGSSTNTVQTRYITRSRPQARR